MNTDATAGRPLTRFGGDYESLADVAAADNVEIHGSPVYDATAQRYEIHATRVERLDSRSHYDKTVFLGLPRPGSAELESQMIRTVRLEGYQEGDVVVARVVRDLSAGAGRRDGDRVRRVPGAQHKPQPWAAYRDNLKTTTP